jgi:hypothetical protein
VKQGIASFFELRMGGESWSRAFDEALNELDRAGQITPVGRSNIELSASGRQATLEFLGTETLPTKLTWPKLRDVYLVPLALGLPAPTTSMDRQRIASANGLQAAILKQHYDLSIPDFPTLAQARDALAWKQLGRESTERFTLTNVLKYLLNRELDPARPVSTAEALKWIVRKLVKARNAEPSQLRLATVQQWCNGETTRANIIADRKAETDLTMFAERVQAAARRCTSGRFGQNKVFIAHVWREVRSELNEMQIDAFKDLLARANNRGLVSLSRADLVEAMEPRDVEESEIPYLNARFHFIRT